MSGFTCLMLHMHGWLSILRVILIRLWIYTLCWQLILCFGIAHIDIMKQFWRHKCCQNFMGLKIFGSGGGGGGGKSRSRAYWNLKLRSLIHVVKVFSNLVRIIKTLICFLPTHGWVYLQRYLREIIIRFYLVQSSVYSIVSLILNLLSDNYFFSCCKCKLLLPLASKKN